MSVIGIGRQYLGKCSQFGLVNNAMMLTRTGSIGLNSILSPLSRTNRLPFQSDQKRFYARKLTLADYKVIWNEPDKYPDYDPRASGDLEPYNEPNSNRSIHKLQSVQEEINKCDDITQKLLSLEFGDESEGLKVAVNDSVIKVQQHQYDYTSAESRIAEMTTSLRYYQKKLNSSEGLTKLESYDLCQLSHRRNKELRWLRKTCYKKFEWVLEKFNICFRPGIRIKLKPMTRKYALKKLIDMKDKSIKEIRMEEYKIKLNEEKEPFLRDKLDTMKWIADNEEKFGLPVSVDVLEAEIELKEYLEKTNKTPDN